MVSYPHLRRCGITARDAFRLVHSAAHIGQVPLSHGVGDVVINGIRVRVRMQNDEDAWERIGCAIYGSFSDHWQPGAVSNRRDPNAPTAWFIPATDYRAIREELRAGKLGRAYADLLARRLVLQAQERALAYGQTWRYVRLVAQAWCQGTLRLQLDTDGVEFEPGRDRPAAIHRIAWTLARQAAAAVRGEQPQTLMVDAYH